ncbi:WxL domain-containing protein [Periweissella cryptocerci]|uniref:WxL domain-containing protein n=1 Tax=Periweissella cryptocerci TaxID=2506420 RepID=A0A4P6YSA8_9LACO|nr:WxL domain-containing protein [Periweissella cryptocerci]QBO35541.1 WxL domain-containing protein [Periweissella cryptocerci]
MKITKLVASSLLATVILGAVPVIANADDSAAYSTTGQVAFVPSTSTTPTTPVNPTDPDTPVVPVDPTNPDTPVTPGTSGPLSIDYISNFDFGSQQITTATKTYEATAQSFTDAKQAAAPLYAQVTDNRGSDAGWNLSAKVSKFTSGANELTGAQISLANSAAVKATTNNAVAPTVSNVTLDPANAATVASAAKGAGAGTWVDSFGSNSDLGSATDTATDGTTSSRDTDKAVTLEVPNGGNAKAQKYTATIDWTLADTPAN